MTKEEIAAAYSEQYQIPNTPGSVGTCHYTGVYIAIDFALEMVRRHNEELLDKINGYNQTYFGIGELRGIIKKAKP